MIIEKSEQIIREVEKVVVGKGEVIRKVLMAMYAGGHILLEDTPGTGKTTIVLAFSRAFDLNYRRVQFNPDTMPSDITGFSMFSKETGKFEYQPGAVNTNLFLGDEINRTSAKTQSALLEVMEEQAVTVDGVRHPVPKPFCVVATQNPFGSAGTQPLPDSQLDRFMIRLSVGYPSIEQQIHMMKDRLTADPLDQVKTVATADELLLIQNYLTTIRMSEDIMLYIARLCEATRQDDLVEVGVSPRGVLTMSKMARAAAILAERDFVTPEDVRYIFKDVCAHRMTMKPQARIEGVEAGDVIDRIAERVESPRMGTAH